MVINTKVEVHTYWGCSHKSSRPATTHRNDWLVGKDAFVCVHASLLTSQLFLCAFVGQLSVARLQWVWTYVLMPIVTTVGYASLHARISVYSCISPKASTPLVLSFLKAIYACCGSCLCTWSASSLISGRNVFKILVYALFFNLLQQKFVVWCSTPMHILWSCW